VNAAMLLPRDVPPPSVMRVSPVLHKGALGTRMIPTVRSMIVAVLLTMTVLVGGFGLFAAFRVNHEPLARLPVAATPFQLASIDGAPRALSFASDQPHLESNEALRAVATAVSAHDPDQAEAAASPATAATDNAAGNAAPEHIATAPVQDFTAAERPGNLSVAPADAVAAVPPPETAQPQTAEAPAPAGDTTRPETAVVVTGSIAEMPPQDVAAPKVAAPAMPADPQETARQMINRKRLAALRRIRRARIVAHAQVTNDIGGFGQPNFQSATGFQSAQSGIGGPFVSPPSAARRQN
jgi:hypothetical protein